MLKAICAPLLYAGGEACVAGMAVLVENGLITDIIPKESVPQGVTAEWHEGCALAPGLFDCHTHIEDWMLPLFLSYGITTVRDMSNEPRYIFERREMMKPPLAAGPQILCCGPGLDGYPYVHENITWAMKDTADVDDAIDYLQKKNVDFVKLYVRLGREKAAHAVKACRERGIHTAAHFEGILKAADAVELGVNEIEHMHETPAFYDASLVEAIAAGGVTVCPTQTVWESTFIYEKNPERFAPDFARVPLGNVRIHTLRYRRAGENADVLKERRAFKDRQREYLRGLIKTGCMIIAGTDTPCQMAMPGVSLIDEIAIYVECGMTNAEAIAAATSAPAKLHGVNAGAIERGRRADIIAVNGDPLKDIKALYDVKAVYKAGCRHDTGALRQGSGRYTMNGFLPLVDLPAETCEDWRELYSI